tara:strand:- start:123 stop:455 length:333 start_codon:yes stop_codon:yes gene_type:complete
MGHLKKHWWKWALGAGVVGGAVWWFIPRPSLAGLSMSESRAVRAKFGAGSEISTVTDGLYQGKLVRVIIGTSAGGQSLSLVHPLGGSVSDGVVFPYAMAPNVSTGTLVKV